jgi:hypothetical protein
MERLEIPPLVFSDPAAVTKVQSAMQKCAELVAAIDEVVNASKCSRIEKKKMRMITSMIKLICAETIANVLTNNPVSASKRASIDSYLRESKKLLAEVESFSLDCLAVPTIPIRPGLTICRDISTATAILALLDKVERRATISMINLRKTKVLRRQIKAYIRSFGEIMHFCAGFKCCLYLDHEALIPDHGWRESVEGHREFNATVNKGKFFP